MKTKGYATSMAISTIKALLAKQYLRRGDGIIATPASRRKERLFGVGGSGRSSTHALGIKLETIDRDYDPRDDTVLAAFIRLISAQAAADAAVDLAMP